MAVNAAVRPGGSRREEHEDEQRKPVSHGQYGFT